MRKLLALALAAAALCASPAFAQTLSRSQTGAVGTVVTCTYPDGGTGKCVLPMSTPVTAAGVQMGSTASPNAVQGNVATGATDSGNPVKTGCVFNTTPPTLTTGQRGDCQMTNRAEQVVTIANSGNPAAINFPSADGAATGNGLVVIPLPRVFNGATWDRQFTCANSAVVNVTAAATTQIVALSGTTVIRVCSIALTMSAAGTAKVLYGTGTNCATGPVDLTGAMALGATTPMAVSAPEGGSLMRSAAGNALCIAAVTGNATGFITYSQF